MTPVSTGTKPRLAMTFGDPSGVGPELAVRLLSDPDTRARADITVLATAEEIASAAAEFGVEVPLGDGPDAVTPTGSRLSGEPVPRGEVSLAGGRRALTDLGDALDLYADGAVDGVMFTPLNKSGLHLAGMHEEDELRWAALRLSFTGFTSELNFIPGLTTARVTSHIGIKDVAAGITAHRTAEAIRLLDRVVAGSGIERPRLGVCALNPHAGESGKFGREEIEHIRPAVELTSHEGIDVRGPFPCDTIFIRARDGEFDGVVTMYHDQGQIAMKLMGFDRGVTVMGGLPVPVATPAHGTAYEIVGQGKAHLGPTQHAFDIAVRLAAQNAAARATAPSGGA